MKSPLAGIVGVEGDRNATTRRNPDRVTHSAGKTSAIDCNDLEMMTVQVHRVAHGGAVDDLDLDAFALCHAQRFMIAMSRAVKLPEIARPFSDDQSVPPVRVPWLYWILGLQSLLQVEANRRRSVIALALQPCKGAVPGREDNTRTGPLAFPQCQDGPGAGFVRKVEQNVKPLSDRELKTAPDERLDRHPVNRDQPTLEFPEIKPETCCARSVYQPQPEVTAPLDPHYLRVVKRSIIGQKGVELDIVKMSWLSRSWDIMAAVSAFTMLHSGMIAMTAAVVSHTLIEGASVIFRPMCCMPAVPKLGKDVRGIPKGEIVEHHDHLLHIFVVLGRIPNDERRGHQALLLKAKMGMHPIGPGARKMKVVVVAPAGFERRLR